MNLEIIEHHQQQVLEAFSQGEFDQIEIVGEADEKEFFELCFREKILARLAESMPTARKKQEVPLWFELAANLSLKLHLENSYSAFERVVQCGGLLSALPPELASKHLDPQTKAIWIQCRGFNDKNLYPRKMPCDDDTLRKAVKDYGVVVRIFLGECVVGLLESAADAAEVRRRLAALKPAQLDAWADLAGMLAPCPAVEALAKDLGAGAVRVGETVHATTEANLTGHTTITFTLSQSAAWKLSIVNQQLETVWSTTGSSAGDAVTWNGVGFDLDILAEESGMLEECRQLAVGHVDMMFHVVCQLGYGVGLGNAAKGMDIAGKLEGMSGAVAPELWAEGRREEVLDYVSQDVRITAELAKVCEACGSFRWITQKGKLRTMALPQGWLSVDLAEQLPVPNTSWMTDPWSRATFTGWLR